MIGYLFLLCVAALGVLAGVKLATLKLGWFFDAMIIMGFVAVIFFFQIQMS